MSVNISKFITDHGITITTERVQSNPMMPHWRDADHWKVVLQYGTRTKGRHKLTTHFSKGHGHKGKPPTAEEVLENLADDAAGYENTKTFEAWAEEYGADPDSSNAKRTFNNVFRLRNQLHRFLGHMLFQTLLWGEEEAKAPCPACDGLGFVLHGGVEITCTACKGSGNADGQGE